MSTQAKVEMYYWGSCPFCVKARRLLDEKGVTYTVYDITGDNAIRAKMVERTGGASSVPQIFINDALIGGCDDLHALERRGALDALLEG